MRIYASLIADELVRILGGVSFASELKVVAKGSLESYPTPDDINDWLDAIIVEIGDWKMEFGDALRNLTTKYNFLVSYIRRHVDGEVAETTDLERAQTICEKILDNVNLDNPSSVLYSYITGPSANLAVNHAFPRSVAMDSRGKVMWENQEARASLVLIEVEVEATTVNAF
jgi:hypothetical protein